jgi:hypothetical protein
MSTSTASEQLLEVEEWRAEEGLFHFLASCVCTDHLSAWKELSDTSALLCKCLQFIDKLEPILEQLHKQSMH